MKRLSIWLLTTLAVILIGFFLMVLVYFIDTNLMEKHFQESVFTMQNETAYKKATKDKTSTLDNFTDSLMLLSATYHGEESTVKKSVNVYRKNNMDLNPYEVMCLIHFQNIEFSTISYFRYWHGYLVFLKPLLLVMNYQSIRIFNLIVQLSLLLFLLYLMYRNGLKKCIIPFLSAYIIINPIAIFMSMQYSSIWYIILVSHIIYLVVKDKIEENNAYYIFFTIVGMLTSYFDLLTYPLATYGMIMITILLDHNWNLKESLYKIVKFGVYWALGYSTMWGSKWILTAIVNGPSIFANVFKAISFRASDISNHGEQLFRLKVIFKPFKTLISKNVLGVLLLNAIFTVFLWCSYKKKGKSHKNYKKMLMDSIPLFLVGLSPFIWFFILANHTYIHADFISFRTTVILWYGWLSGFYKIVNELNDINNNKLIEAKNK